MRLEDQVCSLNLARRLKELGVKQESLYKWIQRGDTADDWSDAFLELSEMAERRSFYISDGYCSAFTVAELGNALGDLFASGKMSDDFYGCSYVGNLNVLTDKKFFAKTEADARAKMLIYVIENGILSSDGVNEKL